MGALNETGFVLISLSGLLALQTLWTLVNPPLLHKPGTWFVHWSLKANLAVTPVLLGLATV